MYNCATHYSADTLAQICTLPFLSTLSGTTYCLFFRRQLFTALPTFMWYAKKRRKIGKIWNATMSCRHAHLPQYIANPCWRAPAALPPPWCRPVCLADSWLISKAKNRKKKKIFYSFANKAPCATYVFMIVCGFFAIATWESTSVAQTKWRTRK